MSALAPHNQELHLRAHTFGLWYDGIAQEAKDASSRVYARSETDIGAWQPTMPKKSTKKTAKKASEKARKATRKQTPTANLGYEATLWKAADALRSLTPCSWKLSADAKKSETQEI